MPRQVKINGTTMALEKRPGEWNIAFNGKITAGVKPEKEGEKVTTPIPCIYSHDGRHGFVNESPVYYGLANERSVYYGLANERPVLGF